MRKIIRNFLNKRNYEIIKQDYLGDIYPNLSPDKKEYYCETPVGNYFLPLDVEKDQVTNCIVRGKYFDQKNIELAKRFIVKGTTVLDVGANFGQMSIVFSDAVGKDGTVYSFEAQDTVFEFLKKNIAANNCTNVIPIDGAVYNVDGKVLVFPEPSVAQTTFSANAINPKLSSGREVTTFTIDSLQIKTPVSFMKVDIQGSDLFAMQGAKQTILKNKMPVFFEFEQQFQNQFETTFQDYVDFVADINYKFAEIVDGNNFLILPK